MLKEYDSVHFMDYMSLQLSKMSGTMAFENRMGDFHPDLLDGGRIIPGHRVSGPLEAAMCVAIDRDLADSDWRVTFHDGLREDRRFQRGLLDLAHGIRLGASFVPGPAAFLRLTEQHRRQDRYTVADLQQLNSYTLSQEKAYDYEYLIALVKTSASLQYASGLCAELHLVGVTDSPTHFRLFERTRIRDIRPVQHRLLTKAEILQGTAS
jgi:hypothetical protein